MSNMQYTAGLPLPTLLTVLFVGLKLTEHITWSWLWVLAPLWIPLVLGCILFSIAMIVIWRN